MKMMGVTTIGLLDVRQTPSNTVSPQTIPLLETEEPADKVEETRAIPLPHHSLQGANRSIPAPMAIA